MNIEKYRNHCIKKKQVTESFPFSNLPDVLVFKVAGKMFTATNIDTFESISVRCRQEEMDEMRAKYPSVGEHTYFKKGWNLVKMDNAVSDKIILQWIDDSYKLAVESLAKNLRHKLGL
jgi:predicted DNA-binding protein (MmcQ/YjbR family)